MYSIFQLNKNVMLCFTCVSKYRHLLREETSTNKLSITTNTFSSITYLCRYFAKDSMMFHDMVRVLLVEQEQLSLPFTAHEFTHGS